MKKLSEFGTTPGLRPASVAPATTMNNHVEHEMHYLPYRRAAISVLLDHDLELPSPESLSLIVESAVAVGELFFAAAIHHPGPAEVRQVFEGYVLSCVSVPSEGVIQ